LFGNTIEVFDYTNN